MGPIFLKHNIRDARDDLTDVALTFRARHAPAVLLFKDEAMHWSMTGRNMPILMRAIERLDIKDGETPAGTWN